MISFFTIPKAFDGHVGMIQRNAIESWKHVHPDCEVFLCADDAGVSQAAAELGVEHIPEMRRNEYGTPLLDDAFRQAAGRSGRKYLCYLNADVLACEDMVEAIGAIPFGHYLMVSRRRDVVLQAALDFRTGTATSVIRELAQRAGGYGGASQIDLFLFPHDRRLLEMPPFAVGRPGWDNWFIHNSLRHRIPIVDATGNITLLHQQHGYGHVPERRDSAWNGPEAERNRELAGGWRNLFSILDATHVLENRTVRPARNGAYLERRVERFRTRRPRLFRLAGAWRLRYLLCRYCLFL